MTMITVYTTSHRTKARMELKRHGIKPYTPPAFGGLVAANDKPAEAVYVKTKIGRVRRDEFARMYARTSKTQRQRKFAVGDKVVIQRGHNAELAAEIVGVERSGFYAVAFHMMGKRCVSKVRERDIAKPRKSVHDYG